MPEFSLNEKEKSEYEKFRSHHCGSIYLKFYTGNGIGIAVIVGCDSCKIEKDISDYESW